MPYKDYEKQKQNALENYYRNKEKRLKQVSDYYYKHWDKKQLQRDNWIKEHPEEVRESKKKYAHSKKGKIAFKKSRKKWEAKNQIKREAHWAVQRAIKKGILINPHKCSICGIKSKYISAHHHKGYQKQFKLDIIWVCPKCHHNEHK